MSNVYLSRPMLACFEGDGLVAGGPAAGSPAAGGPPPISAGEDGCFSQSDLNRILADDRRKHQQALQRAEKAREEVSTSKNLTIQEREELAQQLEDVRKETRTKEVQLLHEKKQVEESYETQAEGREEGPRDVGETLPRRDHGTMLLDAAVSGDAYDTDTMMAVLRPMTKLIEVTDPKTGKATGKFEAIVDFPDADPNTGEAITVSHSPKAAVKRMKELPKYVNLFKSNVVSGVGANAATGGLTPGSNGKIDPRKIPNMETYMAIRAQHPEQLGLRPNKKGNYRG